MNVQNFALRESGGPSRNTLIPSGTKATQSPNKINGDSSLVPFKVPKGKKNMEANAIERIKPKVCERYAPIASSTHPAIIQPLK